jgi:hypothetical protein
MSRLYSAYTSAIQTRKNVLVTTLRSEFPLLASWSDEDVSRFYSSAVSKFQSKNGGLFESCVEAFLTEEGIPFKRQVQINQEGIIVGLRGKKPKNTIIPDIVFGDPQVGTYISEYAVMSLKTSSRERSSQDMWTFLHPPRLFLYGTVDDDYPTPEKFRESDTRKLVCVHTRTPDTRKFKLSFDDLRDCLQASL